MLTKPNCLVRFNKFYHILFLLIFSITSCESDPTVSEKDLEKELTISSLSYVEKECSSCSYSIEPEEWYFDGIEQGVKPGDTIGIKASADGSFRDRLTIRNVIGTEEKPVVIINCNGISKVGLSTTDPFGIYVETSSHFKIAGTGWGDPNATYTNDNLTYGIQVKGHNALSIAYKSTNYEVYGVEVVAASFAGIIARSNASCDGEINKESFTQYNTVIHHNKVHDTDGEGLYVGGSHWGYGQLYQPGCEGTLLFEPELKGVKIYNNIVYDIGLDGIQVGSAVQDCEIYNNYIENFGVLEHEGHMTGFQINPGTTGKLYNNIVNGGKGYGIFMTGRGDNYIYNNLIINPSRDGILLGDRTPTDGTGFYFINNTIINPGDYGINSLTQETTGTVFYNNIITTPGKDFITGYEDHYKLSHSVFTHQPDTLNFDMSDTKYQYNISSNSLGLINKGKDVSNYFILNDLLGNDRPVDGNYDIGAYELH